MIKREEIEEIVSAQTLQVGSATTMSYLAILAQFVLENVPERKAAKLEPATVLWRDDDGDRGIVQYSPNWVVPMAVQVNGECSEVRRETARKIGELMLAYANQEDE